MANERSASSGNLSWDGHRGQPPVQQEPARRARCSARPLAEIAGAPRASSRSCGPASELAIARAFAAHGALPRGLHELQRDLPHRPRAARRVLVLRLPQVPLRVPRARAVQLARSSCARSSARDLLDEDGAVRGLRPARPPPAGTSRSSASARSRRASRRSGCSPRTQRWSVARGRAAAGRGGARRRAPPASATPQAVLALQRRARGARGPDGGRPCASRSLKAPASASGAPAARSAPSPRSWRAGCRRRAIAVAAFDDAAAGEMRAQLLQAPRRPSRRRRGGAARRSAGCDVARPLAGGVDPPARAGARCARAGVPVTTATALWLAEHGRRAG